MTQEQQIKEWMQNKTADWLEEDLPTMEKEFPANREKMAASLSAAIKEVCRQARLQQEAGCKGPAAYLYISFLRTNLLDDSYQYRLDLYDEKFPLDRTECSGKWKVKFIWDTFQKRQTELATAIRTGLYANKIRPFHIHTIKRTMAEKYHLATIVFTQRLIEEALLTPEYANLDKAPHFTIMMGEYQDRSVMIYQEPDDSQDTMSSN